jgi:ribonuclease HI
MQPDIVNFDGSCEPNPGGRIGLGYVIRFADGRTPIEGSQEIAPSRANTVNTAEYQALIVALRAYAEAGGAGPLRVIGDSQLIIYQMEGRYRVRGALVTFHQQAQALICWHRWQVEFAWVRREENTAADMLTQHPDAQIPAPADRCILPAATRVSNSVRSQIKRLNKHAAPGFGDFARLRLGGTDELSRLRLVALEQRAVQSDPEQGMRAVQQIAAAFDCDAQARAAVLRWALRGLAIELAIRKGKVDAEIRRNAEQGRKQ